MLAAGDAAAFRFTPDDNGAYTVWLVVTVNGVASAPVGATLTVTNVAPTATLDLVTELPEEGSEVLLAASAVDPGAVDMLMGFEYDWSVTKDGEPYTSGFGPDIAFTPDDNGSYAVSLTATDKDGISGTTTTSVSVANAAPTAMLSAGDTAFVGSPVTAVLSDASDASWTDTAADLRYSFGTDPDDLETDYHGPDTQADPSRSYTFTSAGTRTIYGRVIDRDNGYSSHSTGVAVVEPILGVQMTDCVESHVATLTGTVANPLADCGFSATVDWGDGQQGQYDVPAGASTFVLTHYYAQYGSYTVGLKRSGSPLSPAEAGLIVAVATPDLHVYQSPVTSDGATYHLEADVFNLEDLGNLSYQWTATEEGASSPFATSQSSAFSFTLPDPNLDYEITATVSNGPAGGQGDLSRKTATLSYSLLGGSTAGAVIPVKPDLPTVSIEDLDPEEGVLQGESSAFRFALDFAADHDVTVFYTTEDDTAIHNRDYTPVYEGEVTIPAGDLYSSTIYVDTNPEVEFIVQRRLTRRGTRAAGANQGTMQAQAKSNPKPIAKADSYMTLTNIPLVVAASGVLANDTGTGTLTASAATNVQNGTANLNSDGSFTFTPATDYVGNDASFQYNAVSNGRTSDKAATVAVQVAGISLTSISFVGAGNFKVQKDPNTTGDSMVFDSPEWKEGRGGQYPVGYSAGSRMEVKAALHLNRAWTGGAIWISAFSEGQIDLPWTKANVVRDTVLVDITAAVAFLSIEDYSNLELSWKATVEVAGEDLGTHFVDVGNSSNRVYVTWKEPLGGRKPLETVLMIGCDAARPLGSQDSKADVVDAIWAKFASRSVRRMDDVQMSYDHSPGMAIYGAEMIGNSDGRGQCSAWAGLMENVLSAQGIPSDKVTLVPKAPAQRFAVKPMPAQGTGTQNYDNGTRHNPLQDHDGFTFHVVVRVIGIDNAIYDPSYGTVTRKTDANDPRSVEQIYEDTVETDVFLFRDPVLSRDVWIPRNLTDKDRPYYLLFHSFP